jgi:hypothetical protein
MGNKTGQNKSIDLKSLILSNINTSWLADMLYLCLIVPLAIFGTIFNLISLIIFSRKSFSKIALFKYLKCYSLVSLVISFTQIFYFYFSKICCNFVLGKSILINGSNIWTLSMIIVSIRLVWQNVRIMSWKKFQWILCW